MNFPIYLYRVFIPKEINAVYKWQRPSIIFDRYIIIIDKKYIINVTPYPAIEPKKQILAGFYHIITHNSQLSEKSTLISSDVWPYK